MKTPTFITILAGSAVAMGMALQPWHTRIGVTVPDRDAGAELPPAAPGQLPTVQVEGVHSPSRPKNSTMFPGMINRHGKVPVPFGDVEPNPKSREWDTYSGGVKSTLKPRTDRPEVIYKDEDEFWRNQWVEMTKGSKGGAELVKAIPDPTLKDEKAKKEKAKKEKAKKEKAEKEKAKKEKSKKVEVDEDENSTDDSADEAEKVKKAEALPKCRA